MITPPTLPFQSHVLKNGLQVILHRNPGVPLVHVSVHYRVGSSYEKPGLSGFAHLFEHMMFQGSSNVAKNEHGKYIDEAGGNWNATTNKDRTNYYQTVPSEYLELVLWLEADRMSSLAVTPENFENQRRTVIEEKKQSYDNHPYGLAHLRFDELAYQNWAYAHPIIGSVEDLEKAGWEDARSFHDTYYVPNRAVLVLSGDIDGERTLEKVRECFEPISPAQEPPEPGLEEPEQREEKRETLRDPLAILPAVYMGYQMPPLGSADHYALSLLSIILSYGQSSRLYRRLIYEKNWITHLSTGPNQYKGPQLFHLWLQLQREVEVDRVVGAVEEELNSLRGEAVEERELEKAKNQIVSSWVTGLSTVAQVGEALARYAVYFGDPHLINREWERFCSLTAEDLLRAADRTFRPPKRTLLVVEPEQAKP